MAKAPRPNTARKPPVPSESYADIEDWVRRVMPDLHPIVKRLDELICETIPGLQYAVKWKRAYYGLPQLGWIIETVALRRLCECGLLRRREIHSSAAAWNHRTDPIRQGEDPAAGAGTGDAQLDRASGARTRLDMMVHEAKTRPPRAGDGISRVCLSLNIPRCLASA